MPETKTTLEMQYENPAQQREAATLGMWVFIATEILFFGGLFLSYAAYRSSYPEVFAVGSHELLKWAGALNTAILLTSSLTVALALHESQHGKPDRCRALLLVTIFLAMIFLCIKGYEYSVEYSEHHVPWLSFDFHGAAPEEGRIFFYLYFFMTGLHAFHVLIGIFVLGAMAFRAHKFNETYSTPLEVTALYWHFVDIVWVYLFPLLYLIHQK